MSYTLCADLDRNLKKQITPMSNHVLNIYSFFLLGGYALNSCLCESV